MDSYKYNHFYTLLLYFGLLNTFQTYKALQIIKNANSTTKIS